LQLIGSWKFNVEIDLPLISTVISKATIIIVIIIVSTWSRTAASSHVSTATATIASRSHGPIIIVHVTVGTIVWTIVVVGPTASIIHAIVQAVGLTASSIVHIIIIVRKSESALSIIIIISTRVIIVVSVIAALVIKVATLVVWSVTTGLAIAVGVRAHLTLVVGEATVLARQKLVEIVRVVGSVHSLWWCLFYGEKWV
jgi:hypothetical protein